MSLQPSPHALIVPGSLQGHINGCMLLAHSLSSIGFSTSFVYFSTAYSELQHKNRLPSLHNSAIRIHVVPDGFENHPDHQFFSAVTTDMREGLEQLVQKLNQENPVTCIVSDTFIPWTQDVADKFGIPRIDYWTSTAMAYGMIMSLGPLYSKGILPDKGSPTHWNSENAVMVDCIPCIPPFPLDYYPRGIRFKEISNPFPQFFLTIGRYAKASERLLIHTVHELEATAIAGLRELQIPAYAIGPLLHHTTMVEHDAPNDEECINWLDTQADSSVIYVAFGSLASLSSEEIQQLACGLEASEQAFLWAIRSDAFKDRELSEVLPDGFVERTKGMGLIISWAPQAKVLEHTAVGGFLTHCGWNSTMESLWAGVPLLGCPWEAEQRANAHYITHEWKVGFELERTGDGGMSWKDVERGVRALMQSGKGYEAREKAEELKEILRKSPQDGSDSMGNLMKFYEDMRKLSLAKSVTTN